MSSYLIAAPEALVAVSADLGGVGAAIKESSAAAGPSMIGIAPAAADEVSSAIASLFSGHGQKFQALSAQAAAFHDEFVSLLNGGAAQYLRTEIANAEQTLANAVNTPAQALLGHPLIGIGQSSAVAATVVHGGSKLFPTTTTTDVQSYGNQGTQYPMTVGVTLPSTQLGNTVANYVSQFGSTGQTIAGYLNGTTPYAGFAINAGNDASGGIIRAFSLNFAGFGFGVSADTANGTYSENVALPFGKEAVLVSPGTGTYSAAYSAGIPDLLEGNGGVMVNTQQGTYAASVGGQVLGVDAGQVVQVNTQTGGWLEATSASLPFNFGGVSLVDDSTDGVTATVSDWFNLVGGSVNVQPNGNITWTDNGFGNSNQGFFDTSDYIYNLTTGFNSSTNTIAVDIDSLFTDSPITQDANSLFTSINNIPLATEYSGLAIFADDLGTIDTIIGDPVDAARNFGDANELFQESAYLLSGGVGWDPSLPGD